MHAGNATGARLGLRPCCVLAAFLEVRDLVAEDFFVDGDQGEAFQLRLGYEQAVEWVAMEGGQGAGPLGVLQGDGQARESVAVNGRDDGLRKSERAGSAFDGDFPD